MKETKHIIQKVFLEINTNTQEKAVYIKDNINGFLRSHLFPELEKLFDNYSAAGESLRFNSIQIDFSVKDWENTSQVGFEVKNRLNKKLQFALLEKNSGSVSETTIPDIARIPNQQNLRSLFLYFLENGYLPWYGNKNQLVTFTTTGNWQASLKDKHFFDQLKTLILNDEIALTRFVLQFSFAVIRHFFVALNSKLKTIICDAEPVVAAFPPSLQISMFKLFVQFSRYKKTELYLSQLQRFATEYWSVFNTSTSNNSNNETEFFIHLKEFFIDVTEDEQVKKKVVLIFTNDILGVKHNKFNNNTKTDNCIEDEEKQPVFTENLFNKTDEPIMVKNAGLILVHPFFTPFFQHINLLNPEGEIYADKRFEAVQSLHFLATGIDDFFESDLLLEKFLCGLPINYPVPRKCVLSEEIKNEANLLLEEVIGNWPALKNTSCDGLRSMFFWRDGKLIHKNNQYKLIVERKAQDILLEKLNWNISILKISWKKELLFVEW